jgi:hypothetical protein
MDAAADESLMDEHQVARLLGVRVGIVRSLRRRGRPPKWIRVSQHPRYRPEDIRQFIKDSVREDTTSVSQA